MGNCDETLQVHHRSTYGALIFNTIQLWEFHFISLSDWNIWGEIPPSPKKANLGLILELNKIQFCNAEPFCAPVYVCSLTSLNKLEGCVGQSRNCSCNVILPVKNNLCILKFIFDICFSAFIIQDMNIQDNTAAHNMRNYTFFHEMSIFLFFFKCSNSNKKIKSASYEVANTFFSFRMCFMFRSHKGD